MEYMIFALVCVALAVAYCAAVTVWVYKKLGEQENAWKNHADLLEGHVKTKVEGSEARLMAYRAQDRAKIEKLEKAVDDLENGIVPDFEEAKAAAKAVNDFNAGISAIMGYDPMKARQKAREGRKGEDE